MPIRVPYDTRKAVHSSDFDGFAMKSEPRKRNTRNKSAATDKDSAATDPIVNDVDTDYARQLLADAEALLSGDDKAPTAATSTSASMSTESNNAASSTKTGAKASKAVSKSMNKSGVSETIAATVVLPSQCVMRDAVELKSRLLPQLEAEDTVQIDVSKVERIDASVIQVLLAFVRDRQRHGGQSLGRRMNDDVGAETKAKG